MSWENGLLTQPIACLSDTMFFITQTHQDVHSRAASLQAQWGPLSAAVAQAKDPKAAAAEVKVKEEKPGALSSTAGTGAGAGQAASQWGAAVRAELEAALCHELMLPMHWCMEIRRREQSGES